MAATPSNDDLDIGATMTGFAAGQIVFGRYKLDRILGRGGMGVVWLAHDQEMGEDVALKFLPEVVRLDAMGLEELKAETRKSRRLTHQNIVRVHDFVNDSRSAGIAMEWVDGSTLAAMRLTRPQMVFEPEELKPWIKQACEALEYAHFTAKLIHRDLKPANIMLNSAGEVKIADFGISSSLTESVSRASARRSTSGTLAYMSPQQAVGERPTVADDIYSLGATIYELIAGKPPFFRGDLYAQVRDVVPPTMTERRNDSEITGTPIPDEWEKAIAACLDKVPANRPQSAMEFAFRLGLVPEFERRAPPEPSKAGIKRVPKEEQVNVPVIAAQKPNVMALAAGAAAVIVAGIAIWFFTRPHPAPIVNNPTPTPAPVVIATPTPVPSPVVLAPTPVPAPIAMIPSPTPAIIATPAPIATPALATPPPVPVVDKKLIGSWQSGTATATRKHWELQADGRYLVSIGGTVTDTGTMTASGGEIEQFSKNNPNPLDVTYSFDESDVITQGNGPFDGTEWHRPKTASSNSASSDSSGTVHHQSSGNDDEDSGNSSGAGAAAKQQMINSLRSRYGF